MFAITVAVAAPALGQTPDELKSALGKFQAAQGYLEANDWSAALALLDQVIEVTDSANVRHARALCEVNLGRLRDALMDYERAYALAKDAGTKSTVRPTDRDYLIKTTQRAIDGLRERVPVVRVDRLPSDAAKLWFALDGRRVTAEGLLKGEQIDPGDRELRVEGLGVKGFWKPFHIEEREQIVLIMPDIEPLPPLPRHSPAASSTLGASLPASRTDWYTVGGWAGVGVGGVAFGAGLYMAIDGIRNETRSSPLPYILLPVGGAALGVGLGLLLSFHDDPPRAASKVSQAWQVRPSVGRSSVDVALSRNFLRPLDDNPARYAS